MRSAAALQAAGNDIDQSIGLFTAAQTVTQDADVVGTALKTIGMRLRSTKSELSDAGEDTDGAAESISKLRDEIKALSGVDIQADDSTYKDTYTVLQEISQVWDKISDMGQASILELLFGKRQGNIGAAILSNFDIAEAAMETSQNSAGSAMKEFDTWGNSLEGHLGELQAKWETFSVSLADSTGLKAIIDTGGAVVSILNQMTSAFGSLGTIAIPAVAAMSKFANVGKQLKYALLCGDHATHRMLAA